jgi:hypothetical protein
MYERYSSEIDATTAKRLVDKHHERIFNQCFTIGGRRRSNEFDHEKYERLMDMAVLHDLIANP